MLPKKPIEWTREDVLELVELYKRETVLYDKNDCQYKNRFARNRALENIANAFIFKYPQVTSMDIKFKLNCLRGQFSGEIGKIKSQGGDDENHDEPYWFSKLMFLEPHLRLRKPTNSSLAVKMEEDFRLQTSGTKRLKTDISILQSEVKLKPNMAALSWDEPEPKIEADEVENQMDSENRKTEKMGEMPQTFVRPCPTRMFTDVIEAFGEYIKAELAELPTEQQAEIRRKIVKTMFETQSE